MPSACGAPALPLSYTLAPVAILYKEQVICSIVTVREAPSVFKKEKQKLLILSTESKDVYSHSAFIGIRHCGEFLLP